MEKNIIEFDDIEIQKQRSCQIKRLISMKNKDINKVLVFNKAFFDKKGFKYFIGYDDVKKIVLYVYL